MHDTHGFLQTLTVVLCAAAVTTVVFQRLRQPVVLGYLLAGLVVGPHVPIPLQADMNVVQTLAELGVILLMFSLGIEFSLQKLLKVGPTVGFVALVQCCLMIWLGYVTGQAFGWTWLQSLFAGAAISISSTTIVVKAFEEQGIKDDFTQIVFGILIVEDLIAILLITILTTLAAGRELGARELAITTGRLSGFLLLLIVVGLLTVPRLMRSVVNLRRDETTLVASIGVAFGFAYLAAAAGYSVALGAFIAGSMMAESGVSNKVEHLVMPVRDMFAAIFFVSVGMMIDPISILDHWGLVLVFLAIVVVGEIVAVTLGCFLVGQSVQTSVKTGMSLAQIGEFSFIIAGVGVATASDDARPTYELLYSIAVALSGITTLLTPWLIRASEPTGAFVDRKLPRSLQTFVALYGTWLESMRASKSPEEQANRAQQLVRWMVVDAVIVAAIVIGASLELNTISSWAQQQFQLSPNVSTAAVVAGAAIVSAPFWIGLVRMSRELGFELASRVFPSAKLEQTDLAAAPRRLLVVTLQLAIVLSVGIPLVAITQPFVPTLRGAAVLVFLLALLAFAFWRNATNLQGHTRAAAQAMVQAIGRQTRKGRAMEADRLETQQKLNEVNRIITGLGSPVSIELRPGTSVVGRTLAEIKLRGLTGATILAIEREGESVVVPAGNERLRAGDVLALAGTHAAIEAARELLAADDIDRFSTWQSPAMRRQG
ncbi:MAG: cation:proton antiporter [Pirellulales bacterium]